MKRNYFDLVHATSWTYPLFIGVPLPSQGSQRSCNCVLRFSIFPICTQFWFWQSGIFGFHFFYLDFTPNWMLSLQSLHFYWLSNLSFVSTAMLFAMRYLYCIVLSTPTPPLLQMILTALNNYMYVLFNGYT